MQKSNYLLYQDGKVIICGFSHILGAYVHIGIHDHGISFERWQSDNLETCILFDEATLNKSVVIEFLKKHHVFQDKFVFMNNAYLPVRK